MDSNVDVAEDNRFPYLPEDYHELPNGQRIYQKFGDDVISNNGPTDFEVNGLHELFPICDRMHVEFPLKDEIVIAKTKQLVDDMSSGSELESEDDEDDKDEQVKEGPYHYWHLFIENFMLSLTGRRSIKRTIKNTELSSKLSALSTRRKNETAEGKRERKKTFKQCRKELSETKKKIEIY